jgi:hypothetical protein
MAFALAGVRVIERVMPLALRTLPNQLLSTSTNLSTGRQSSSSENPLADLASLHPDDNHRRICSRTWDSSSLEFSCRSPPTFRPAMPWETGRGDRMHYCTLAPRLLLNS